MTYIIIYFELEERGIELIKTIYKILERFEEEKEEGIDSIYFDSLKKCFCCLANEKL